MREMRIPFGTITITDKSKKLILDCLEKGRISGGKYVHEFEERFADIIGAKEAVAVSSGTDADTLALAVLHDIGAQRGDEVITPALSFVATGSAVLHAGFTPIFVDIDPETLNIDPDRIEKVITKRTRAIIPTHLMGKPAAMDQIIAIAKKHKLVVVEDAAEAYGAKYRGNNIGALGDMGAFSLYVAHIITTGEGGIIVTDNTQFAEILRSLRAHGRVCKCKQCISNINSGFCENRFSNGEKGDIRFLFERIGYSCKMNELEAALGLGNLDLYDEILEKRYHNLRSIMEKFKDFSTYLWTFKEESYERIGPHAFPFVVKKGAPFTRDELMLYLEHQGIDARTLFSSIPTQCGGFEFLGHKIGDFPYAEYIGRHGIHIGVHHDVNEKDIDWFFSSLRNFIKAREYR
ncbi:MAG: DegT/DnrJ/EryC1/StrS family aminotransferase [Deltaproteobacteria bacterium]|nr:DegT/DnrJ/EryC1/StrS family aminotransferase [Deltaproteobacteria bacterium]